MNTTLIKPEITYEEFLAIQNKLDIRIGEIIAGERIPKSKKLLKLTVDFKLGEPKTVVTNLGDKFEPEQMIGVKAPFIMNLKPSVMMGVESQAMIMVSERVVGDGVAFELSTETYSVGSTLL